MTFTTIPVLDRKPRTTRSLSSIAESPISFMMTVVAYAVIGFTIFVIIGAVIDKIVELITGSPPKTSLVNIVLNPLKDLANAVGAALAAPFQGLATIFLGGAKEARPLGAVFYYIVFIVIPVIALAVWFIWRRRR